MLFTWDTNNLCIVFRQWHVRSTTSLIISLLAVVLLAVGYEGLRSLSRRYEDSLAKRVQSMPSKHHPEPPPPSTIYIPPSQVGNLSKSTLKIIGARLWSPFRRGPCKC